ncbi:Crp/Fnr family transcriptional regulator [Pedobacter antarcticus]|uniref:Crp/Fnr family transcriptional regulator n=1 Tax=Pedobacter antarcticus TaxID=34086 RepID=UPI0008822F2C|nr:Crp/Fnr family transcriptional regulator [Pedobacter antarcticus]SDM26368.1 cAMP-binding domain of CRP or a regulatory subunit of cAMP-dependent protein kinases [Pedobacter antarcticus]
MCIALRHQFEEFIQLTDEEFEYVCSFFHATKFNKHSLIIQTGDVVDREYFVVKGLLKTFVTDENGKEHILQFAMENWWVSDYQALNTKERAGFNIECLEEVEILYFSLADKNKLCDEMPKIERFFRLKTTSGFLNLQKRVMVLIKNDALSRYKQLYEQYPTLFQRVPKSMIAAYLGVTRETLSRLSI